MIKIGIAITLNIPTKPNTMFTVRAVASIDGLARALLLTNELIVKLNTAQTTNTRRRLIHGAAIQRHPFVVFVI
jgi:hypothetical protein